MVVQLRQVSSLSKTEEEALQMAHKKDALPSGWYYNQGVYVDAFGDCQSLHPNLSDHIANFIDKENEKIQAANRSSIEKISSVPTLDIISVDF